ncbi:nucleosome-remodeling factor subunit BPTF [Paragonimus westermani]|uniref:Nucleosome-remodeling factor subunit BPTF n=1 Tax=Paragonimus westermani TaxID=34504 RepID=A0A5J4P1R5_9TREM|nr:nucleosome-remodeling factor subunit BPTF [Paragonimus westermani]
MSVPPTVDGSGGGSGLRGCVVSSRKRTKVVFLNPTEITNWERLEDNVEQKLIDKSDILQYEELLKNKPRAATQPEVGEGEPIKKKKRGRPRGSKSGAKKKYIDPSRPWLEEDDSDERDFGLEAELDDDEYFRRLEEEKLREDEEEAQRKKEATEARVTAYKRAKGSSTGRIGRPPSAKGRSRGNQVDHPAMSTRWTEASESEDQSDCAEGTLYSSVAGSRLGCDELENTRCLYTHDELDELEERSLSNDVGPCSVLTSPRLSEEGDETITDPDHTIKADSSKLAANQFAACQTPTDPYTVAMLSMDPIQLCYQSPCLRLPVPASDLVCPPSLLLDAFSVYEVLSRYGRLLRLSPFKIEDFLAALVANENSLLLSDVHIALLKCLMREDDAAGTTMYSVDCKDSVSITFFLLDRYTWPTLLASYLASVKSTEAAAQAAASKLSALSMSAAYAAGAVGCGPTGGGGADAVLSATLFPTNLIPLDPAYPFVSIEKRVAVLRGLVNLILATGPVRGDVLRDGFLPHEDHCRLCHQSGDVLCCDGCPAVFHLNCLHPPLSSVPPASWLCPVCVQQQTMGLTDCLSDAERAGKIHRREPLGTDRAGRVYWYIGRRIVVITRHVAQLLFAHDLLFFMASEPVCFAQREPCLPGLLDGFRDSQWMENYIMQLLKNNALSPLPIFPDDENQNDVPDVNSRIRCSPTLDYIDEPPVYYYSSYEQVVELRRCLSTRWEPWLCQRLDALMPRLISEMNITQKLTEAGLESFCQSQPDCRRLNLSGTSPVSSTLKNVYSVFELEAGSSNSRSGSVSSGGSASGCSDSFKVLCAFDAQILKPCYPGHLPEGLSFEPAKDEAGSPGVLITLESATCVIRNIDSIITRVRRAEKNNQQNPHLTLLNNDELASLSAASLLRGHFNQSVNATFVAYRLSDEGDWRSWTNAYTAGVWCAPASGDSIERDSKNCQPMDRRQLTYHSSTNDDGPDAGGPPVNLSLSRAQFMEEKERRRLLGNKFNLTDLAFDLWQYVDPPAVCHYFVDLANLLKFPCDLDDRLHQSTWPANSARLLDVARLTLCHFEAQASTVCIQIRHLTFERTTTAQREEDRRMRQMDRSSSNATQNSTTGLPSNVIRTKTPRPVRHTVWKARGEEYRRLGGDGWMWVSSTRRAPKVEAALQMSIYPTINQLARIQSNRNWKSSSMDDRFSTKNSTCSRGLQHGIGWGVCPEYLQGQIPIKPPKSSECRGHVLHPITGIPLYLNPRRTPYVLPVDELRRIEKLAAFWESTDQNTLSSSKSPSDSTIGDLSVDVQPKVEEDGTVISVDAVTPLKKEGMLESESGKVVTSEASQTDPVATTCKTEAQSPTPSTENNLVSAGVDMCHEPPVLNISYCLQERIHFPPAISRPPIVSPLASSRRLVFRLDHLLARRRTAAEADKRTALAASAAVESLEVNLDQLEQRRVSLIERLNNLHTEAQEARTTKARALAAKMSGEALPLASTVALSSVQNLAGSSKQLIQHSVVTVENGPRFRIPALRRSARKQRSARHDPDFVVDFDDDMDEEDDEVEQADLDDSDVERRLTRGPSKRDLPQLDGADDESTDVERENHALASPSVQSGVRRLKRPCSEDPCDAKIPSKLAAAESTVTQRPVMCYQTNLETPETCLLHVISSTDASSTPSANGYFDNDTGDPSKKVRLSSELDLSSLPAPCEIDCNNTVTTQSPIVVLESCPQQTDGLRLTTASTATQGTPQVVTVGPVSVTNAPTSIVIPQTIRLAPATTPVSLMSASVRLLDGKAVRAVPAGTPTNVTVSRLPSGVPVSFGGSNAVRLILSSAPSTDSSGSVMLSTTPVQTTAVCANISEPTNTLTICPTSTSSATTLTTRHQPAILRRTLATISTTTGQPVPTEFKFFTIPQTQSLASVVAANTARKIVCGDLVTLPTLQSRSSTGDVDGSSQSRRSLSKAEHARNIPLIQDRAMPRAPVLIAPRILPKPGGPGIVTPFTLTQQHKPSEAQLALNRAASEATAQLQKLETEMLSVKSELTTVDQKLAEVRKQLGYQKTLKQQGNPTACQPYSLNCPNRRLPESDTEIVLPTTLPAVNDYVWPPVKWSEERKQRSSTSSLFRWNSRNLRSLVLAAGRRELPGFDVEKKRLAQIIWPYPTSKPALSETWRFRLSQLRLGPYRDGNLSHPFADVGQDLACLLLLLRTLWHCIRWDDILCEPPDGEHVLDQQGRPCLRELVDYADSGSAKSGEPAFCTRKIVGIQPLDRFWQRANYLVRLTHTRPIAATNSRAKKPRGPGRPPRASRKSVGRRGTKIRGSSGSESPNASPRLRGRGQKPNVPRGKDPDYDPAHDEGWRVGIPCVNRRRGRRTDRSRRSSVYGSDDDDEIEREEDEELSADSYSRNSDFRSRIKDENIEHRELRVEEQWMSEDCMRIWEIRTFMDEFISPDSDYLNMNEPHAVGDGKRPTVRLRLPARLPTPLPTSTTSSGLGGQEASISQARTSNEPASSIGENHSVGHSVLANALISPHNDTVPTPMIIWNIDSGYRVTVGQPSQPTQSVDSYAPAVSTRRRAYSRDASSTHSPVVHGTPLSPSVLEAKAKARSLAAARAAKASVAARKMRAERVLLEQRVRALRSQFVTRRRLHLSYARMLAEDSAANLPCRQVEELPSHSGRKHSPTPLTDLPQMPARGRRRGRPPLSSRNSLARSPLVTTFGDNKMKHSGKNSDSSDEENSSGSNVAFDSPDSSRGWEEQENEPDWTPAYGSASRRRGCATASTPSRRGRGRGRGRGASRLLSSTITPSRNPVWRSPGSSSLPRSVDQPLSADLSSAPSTPSTCPGLGDETLERLLLMHTGTSDKTSLPVRGSKKRGSLATSRSSEHVAASGRGRGGRGRGSRDRGATDRQKKDIRLPISLATSGPLSVPNPEGPKSRAVYCVCKTPYDPAREYLGCDLCQDWFHFECVGLSSEDAARLGDSWHCPECKQAETNANELLYCLCRTPYEPARVYIACDGCDEWYHAECVGLTSQQAANHTGTYICPLCSKSIPKDDSTTGASATSGPLPLSSTAIERESEDNSNSHGLSKTIYETCLSNNIKVELVRLVETMRAHKMSWPLLSSLDPAKYPGLSNVAEPKNLTLLLDDLNSGAYKTLGDFSFAMNRIFVDARIVFPRDSPEFHCTDVMEALFIQQMKQLKTHLFSQT